MIPEATIGLRWSLKDLLPEGIEQLERILGEIDTGLIKIESYRSLLTGIPPEEDFFDLLHFFEAVRELTALIAAYAYLSFAENTQDPVALGLQDRVNQIITNVDNRTMFLSLWFKALPDDAARLYIEKAGDLRYYLESLRRYKPFTLSEPEEKIINLKDSVGNEALVKIYEVLTNSFSFSVEVDGEVKKLTRDGLSRYYHHPSADVRAAAYRELYRVYAESRIVLAQIYSYLVRDWVTEGVDLRGYSSPISIRNLSNDLPDDVVEVLLEVCSKNAGLFQRYFKLKAHLLNMDKLRRYDIYAPIAQAEKTYEFEAALRLILDSFKQFSPQVSQPAVQVLEASHLDADMRPGKRGGAFSYSPSPKLIPWVMVNFNKRIHDVTTLAHELGHSVHSMLASGHSILTFHPPTPLAETASVFAEMLVTDQLLIQERDPSVQRDLLVSILDNAYATVLRQAFISIFEREAHAKISQGGTSDELADIYRQNLRQQFGEAVELTDEFAWEWLTIPHIFSSPFYPYAYSFGQLLVLALYQRYLDRPESFVHQYLKLLSYGGSAAPMTILSKAGLDISSPEFWQGGFEVLRSKLVQLEEISGGDQ